MVRGEVLDIDLEQSLTLKLDVDGEDQQYTVHPQAMMVTKGQSIQIAPKDRQYGSKTVGQRAMAIFAGPLMNFILAFILFGLHIQMVGIQVDNPTYVQISEITAGMPAAEADLHKGDIIESVNGIAIGANVENMIKLIADSQDKPMKWTVRRDNKTFDLTITPRAMEGQRVARWALCLNFQNAKQVWVKRSNLPDNPWSERPILFSKDLASSFNVFLSTTWEARYVLLK